MVSPFAHKISAIILIGACVFIALFGSYSGGFNQEQAIRYGPWAVVAGASEGLGAEWARQLAGQGLNVLLIARREKQVKEVADTIRAEFSNVTIDTLVADLLDLTPTSIYSNIQKKGKRRIGLMVYNAMYTVQGNFLSDHITVDKLKKIINVNNVAMIELMHPLMKSMQEDKIGGGVVLMSSISSTAGVSGLGTYSSSKAFITTLARTLHNELRKEKIDVLSCIAGATLTPNYIAMKNGFTDVWDNLVDQYPSQVVDECISALGRTSSVATGPVNKFVRILLERLIPTDLATWWLNYESAKRIGVSHTNVIRKELPAHIREEVQP